MLLIPSKFDKKGGHTVLCACLDRGIDSTRIRHIIKVINIILNMKKSEKIIGEIEVLLRELKREVGISIKSDPQSDIKEGNNFSGLTEGVFNLIGEGFFDTPKPLSEIQKKLKEGGINKPTTALMKPILFLIRKKILGRNKPEEGQYQYYNPKK